MSQNYYMDKDGNLIHTRSGDMIKRRVEVNRFTGEGGLISVEHNRSKPRKKEKKQEKKSKLEILHNSLWCLELDLSWCEIALTCFKEEKTNKNLEGILTRLERLGFNVTTVIKFVEEFREENGLCGSSKVGDLLEKNFKLRGG